MLAPLSTQDWFTGIRDRVLELPRLERRVQELREQSGVKCQRYDAVGHASGPNGADARVIAIAETEQELERFRVALEAEMESAIALLYGRDNRGGLARAKGSACADCICGYYLQGMTWRQVADELVRPDSRDGAQWCRRKAYRAMRYVDAVGARYVRSL